jgi:hypothetical protein
MEQPEALNLKNISFDEFVSLIFHRGAPAEQDNLDTAFYEVEIDAKKLCSYYVQLFRQPEFLLSQFTKQQLEDGFWAIMGNTHEWSAGNLIDYSDAPLASRKECIESMAILFERLFVNEPLDTSVHMWWDPLCYAWHSGNRKRENGGEDSELQDIFFHTLVKVLALDSWICQGAALHGLGHLHHPNTAEVVRRFIEDHPSLTEEQIAYAHAAARFDVL